MYNVLEYLENTAAKYPEKIAFADLEKEITYSGLLARSRRIGARLARKFDKNSPVPIFMEKGVDAISLFFGVIYAGCFYVMMDLKQPKARLEHILITLETDTVVTDIANAGALHAMSFEGKILMFEDFDKEAGISEDEIDEILASVRKKHIDSDPLYGIFTSGSTGVPKGVVVSHRNLIDFMGTFTKTFDITSDDVLGNQAPWDFDVSIKDIFSAVSTGATVQIIPKQYFSMPAKLIDFLCERKVTTIIWAVSAVCIISTLKGFDYRVPTSLKKVMFSGEVMPVKHLNIWKKYLPDATYVNLYGPTEITCNCAYHVINEEYQDGDVIPIGEAFENERVFLLDEEDRLVLPGTNESENKLDNGEKSTLGEICVSGNCVSLGYYNNDEQTKKAFCQNPLNKKYREIIYRTGDLGYYDKQGRLCFASRKDFQIKHMGHRIELGEIENAMYKIPQMVRVCCLFENNRIIAFYKGEIQRSEIVKELKKWLPDFMVPNMLKQIDEFPLNKNGKIDRGVLKEMLSAKGGR